MAVVSFHFHGYQPGDVVRWLEPDPLRPQRFEERRSPVAHTIGGERVVGGNWTAAVLHAYGRMGPVLENVAGAASVDIEPQTLVWLLERDANAYRRALAAYEKGAAGFAITPPFHAILPHHHALERAAMFDLMIDFFAPLLRRVQDRPIGLGLPEAAYSAETMASYRDSARRAMVDLEDLPDLAGGVHLLVDARQVEARSGSGNAWGRTEQNLRLMARDPALSGDFAFGVSKPAAFCGTMAARAADSVLVASDLESLLANPAQAERFAAIVETLRSAGDRVAAPRPPEEAEAVRLVDFSSWSDYDDQLGSGHTSDTRWTGLRRWDGLVVARDHRGQPLSQLWKHAFTLVTEQIETAVRRAAQHVLRNAGVQRIPETLRRLTVAYGRHIFEAHYRACGFGRGDVDFAGAADRILEGKVDVDLAGRLARGYVLMLMGLRSDPRFWDNPDTRVTFQNVALLSQAVVDLAEAARRLGDEERATKLLRMLRVSVLEFPEAYERHAFGGLRGLTGRETTEAAWHASLQSDVPSRSAYDVFRRAALFAAAPAIRAQWPEFPLRAEEIAADTGHIVGEAHGDWENKEWCEHRVA
ncbi:MAG: hypothetical protein AABX97_09005 [Candidatus Thermoplasmatota archaeon]